MTTELFRNGEQPFGSASAEWSVLGVLTHCGLPRVCWVLWTSPEEPPAPAGAPLEAGWSLALLILLQTSLLAAPQPGLRAPAPACTGEGGAWSQNLKIFWKRQ